MSAAAPSWAAAFSPLVFNSVPASSVQAELRTLFGCYGLPAELRWDNGAPWGGGPHHELPTAFALWLAGLGVGLTFNPPRQPRYNGVVEKSHETNQRWSEPATAGSAAQWQARVDEMDRRQREAYPYLRGRSRVEVFPQLRHSGREYSVSWEQENWDLQQAREYLAGFVAERKVSSAGRVMLYQRAYYVGRKHAGTTVLAQYDPQANEWFMTEAGGGQIRRWGAPEISRERILALDISGE